MTDPFTSDFAEQLRTQDNAITCDPIFVVQEKARDYGLDTDYCEGVAWLHADGYGEVYDDEWQRLEADYLVTMEEPENFIRTGYRDRWEFVQPFFLRSSAEAYIKTQAHRHSGELRIYVESAYRNPEWQAIREALMRGDMP